MTILTDIKILGREVGDDPLWTVMSPPVFEKSDDCFFHLPTHLYHISFSATSNQVCVNNDIECKLLIKTETGNFDKCEFIMDFLQDTSFGIHTVNRDNELIYIDTNLKIKKIL